MYAHCHDNNTSYWGKVRSNDIIIFNLFTLDQKWTALNTSVFLIHLRGGFGCSWPHTLLGKLQSVLMCPWQRRYRKIHNEGKVCWLLGEPHDHPHCPWFDCGIGPAGSQACWQSGWTLWRHMYMDRYEPWCGLPTSSPKAHWKLSENRVIKCQYKSEHNVTIYTNLAVNWVVVSNYNLLQYFPPQQRKKSWHYKMQSQHYQLHRLLLMTLFQWFLTIMMIDCLTDLDESNWQTLDFIFLNQGGSQ